MDEIIDLRRAEQAQPGGYHPHRITEPPDVAWQDVRTYVPEDPADLPCVLPARAVQSMVNALDGMRLMTDLITEQGKAKVNGGLAAEVSAGLGRVQRVLRTFAGVGLVAALAVAAIVLAPSPAAQASTVPTSSAGSLVDAPSYTVVQSARVVQLRIPMVTTWPVPGTLGLHCGSVRTSSGRLLGRACSYSRAFTVAARIDAAVFAPGRTVIWLSDDADPAARLAAVLTALRPSQVTATYVADGLAGRVFVAALLQHYNAGPAVWAPSKLSPLHVQVATRRGWRTRGTITTDVNGYASGYVGVGAGTYRVRLVRPVGATVTGAVSTVNPVTVTNTAIDLA